MTNGKAYCVHKPAALNSASASAQRDEGRRRKARQRPETRRRPERQQRVHARFLRVVDAEGVERDQQRRRDRRRPAEQRLPSA